MRGKVFGMLDRSLLERGSTKVADEPVSTIVYDGDARAEGALALVQRRAPQFFIMERLGELKFCTADLLDTPLLERSRRLIASALLREGSIASESFERLDARYMLRVVPLTSESADCYAVFVEPVNGRNAVERTVRHFNISRREADVLELLVDGYSTAQIAERLCISEGTVGDHVKSLFRKTKANKRSELVSRVFRHHQDPR
jgi:DNA-binding CsgD family transcriptional regulator